MEFAASEIAKTPGEQGQSPDDSNKIVFVEGKKFGGKRKKEKGN